MTMLFTFVHLSDFHFCIEPKRHNAMSLLKRKPRLALDTALVAATQGYRDFRSLSWPASYCPDIISGVAQFCYARRDEVDGIIVTGDLATTGMAIDIAVAYKYISDPATDGYTSQPLVPTLNIGGTTIHVVPGNYDKYVDNIATPGCKTFELRFSDYMANFDGGVGYWIERKGDAYLGFVNADFSLQFPADADSAPYALHGQGKVYPDILERLKVQTLALRERFKGIRVVWIIHFAPFECGYYLRLYTLRPHARGLQVCSRKQYRILRRLRWVRRQ